MSTEIGNFVWYDLMTTDMEASSAFYREVVGLDAKDSGMTDRQYSILSAGDTMVAGLMPIPEEIRVHGAQPAWLGYISVDDVDSYADNVQAAGGAIQRAPADIPGIGRFAVVTDPHSAAFYLFNTPSEPQAAQPGQPGHIGWRELHAGSLDEALTFYTGLFHWQKTDTVDMGSSGVYQTFSANGTPTGGMMTKTPQTPAPFWLYYFNVPSVQAAADRASQLGATIINGPMDVTGGMSVVQMLDPQGAIFAVLGPKQ